MLSYDCINSNTVNNNDNNDGRSYLVKSINVG